MDGIDRNDRAGARRWEGRLPPIAARGSPRAAVPLVRGPGGPDGGPGRVGGRFPRGRPSTGPGRLRREGERPGELGDGLEGAGRGPHLPAPYLHQSGGGGCLPGARRRDGHGGAAGGRPSPDSLRQRARGEGRQGAGEGGGDGQGGAPPARACGGGRLQGGRGRGDGQRACGDRVLEPGHQPRQADSDPAHRLRRWAGRRRDRPAYGRPGDGARVLLLGERADPDLRPGGRQHAPGADGLRLHPGLEGAGGDRRRAKRGPDP